MNREKHNLIKESVLKILRPLMRVMLRNGISCGSFSELVRKAYVDEAFEMGMKNGKKATVSSISAQTGLSRKEVKRLHELSDLHHAEVEQRYNRAIRVISGWLHDGDFIDEEGNSKKLSLNNEAPSFFELTRRYSGDITAKAMLDLLQTANCVKVEGNQVELVKHAYVPGTDSAEIIRILGVDTQELITTINHNLTVNENKKRFQRKVSNAYLDCEKVKEFKQISRKRAQDLLEDLDAWLSNNEVDSEDENTCYVSLGIYYYEQPGTGEEL